MSDSERARMNPPRASRAFDAFLSYSHAADMVIAAALQSALHRLAKPWYRIRAIRVFRDRTDLSAAPELWGSIAAALDSSGAFIFLASHASASSKWTHKEIEAWFAANPAQRFYIALTEGEIAWDDTTNDFDWSKTTLPRSLSKRFSEVPMWVDLRWARLEQDLSLRNPRFADAAADLAAAVRGVSKATLVGEDVRQQRATMRIAWSAGIALFLLTAIATIAGGRAIVEGNAARAQTVIAQSRQRAVQAASFLSSPLANDLTQAQIFAAEANRSTTTPESFGTLLSTLSAQPRLEAVLHGSAEGVAADDSGSVLYTVGEELGETGFNTQRSVVQGWDIGQRVATSAAVGAGWIGSEIGVSSGGKFVAGRLVEGVVVFEQAGRTARLVFPTDDVVELLFFIGNDSVAYLASDQHDDRHVHVRRLRAGAPNGDFDLGRGTAPTAVSADGKLFAAADGKRIVLWDVAAGKRLPAVLCCTTRPPSAIAISGDRSALAAVMADRTVSVWRGGYPFLSHTSRIQYGSATKSIAMSHDGTLIATAGDGNVELVSSSNLVNVGTIATDASDLVFVADGLLATRETAGLRLWNVAPEIPVLRPVVGCPLCKTNKSAISGSGNAVAVVTGADDAARWTLRTFDRSERRQADVTFAHAINESLGFAFLGENVLAFTHGYEGLALYEAATLKPVPAKTPADPVVEGEMAADPAGERLAFGTTDADVVVWRRSDGTAQRFTYDKTTNEANLFARKASSVTFSPDGSRLAWAYGVDLLATDQGMTKVAHHIQIGDRAIVMTIGFAPGGDVLATGDILGGVRIWDAATLAQIGEPLKPRQGGDASVSGLSFTPDGEYIAVAYSDGTIVFYSRRTGAQLNDPIRLTTIDQTVTAASDIQFSDRNQLLLLVDGAPTTALYALPVDVAAWQRRACRAANLRISKAERVRYFDSADYRVVCDDFVVDGYTGTPFPIASPPRPSAVESVRPRPARSMTTTPRRVSGLRPAAHRVRRRRSRPG